MKNKNYFIRGLGKSYDVKIVEREKQCYGFTMESLGTGNGDGDKHYLLALYTSQRVHY